MSFRFRPTGFLDIETDATVLPEQSDGKNVFCGDMAQLINLRTDRPGQLTTRYGSSRYTTATTTAADRIIEQDGSRYVFGGTKIYRDESQIKTATTAADWTLAQYRHVLEADDNIYATNGTDKYRIHEGTVNNWGIVAPVTNPNASATGSGSTYQVAITWARQTGTTVVAESNPSPISTIVTSGSTDVSEAVAPTDTQITHFRVYVSAAGGGVLYYAATGLVGATVTVTLPNAAGTAAPNDLDPPPANITCLGGPSNGYLFAGVGHRLFFCKPMEPEYWPTDYYIEVGAPQFPITAIVEMNTAIFIVTTTSIWQLYGSNPDTFYAAPLKSKAGAIRETGVEAVAGMGLFHIDEDGLYLWDGALDNKVTGRIGPIWRGETVGNIPGANLSAMGTCWIQTYRDKVFIGYPSGTETTPSRVIAMSMGSGRSSIYDYPANFVAACIDRQNTTLLVVDTSGYLWVLEDETLTTDNSATVAWEVESKAFTDTLVRFFPRNARYDIEVSGTATGSIKLEGVVTQSHAITGATRDIKKRLVSGCNGQRLSLNISGSGVSTIYGMEVS